MTEDDDQLLDTHFEIALDDEPAPTREPVYVDVVAKDHERRPIIPAALRPENIAATLRYYLGLLGYRAGYHSWRAVVIYVPVAVFWAVPGVFKLAGRQVRWWWHPELHAMLQHAASKNDLKDGRALHHDLSDARRKRAVVLLLELLGLAVTLPLLVLVAPWWLQLAVTAAVVPPLACVGRPIDRRIIQPAVVVPRYRKLNADIVLRAYYLAGLGHPDKPDPTGASQKVEFDGPMSGHAINGMWVSTAAVVLPHSKTFAEVITAKAKLASALDVGVFQVYPSRDPQSERRHRLTVLSQDPLAIPAGKTPLLDCRPRDIWKPAPLGLDERGQKVTLVLLFISILVGAQPRKGKTFFARAMALFAALDPYVVILVADGKMSPDWDKFRLVAHRYVCGVVPNARDNDPITHFLDMLREVKKHIEDVNNFLSTLPVSECPEGKLTREISRKYPQARVWMLVIEEFQNYFETPDQEVNKQIANDLSFIMAVGPSAGVILIDASQKPSGVGAGDVARLFNRFRDNHQVRFALKCGNRIVSEAILGGDAYAEGYDASTLPVGDGTNGTADYRGIGYLYGASDATPLVRTYLADHEDAEKILIAARRHREAAGTLTGEAAGEDTTREYRDVLRDVRSVFYAGEAWVSWRQIAMRLAENEPEAYADVTQESISAQVRAFGIEAKKGKDNGASLWGVPRDQLDLAVKRREIGDGR